METTKWKFVSKLNNEKKSILKLLSKCSKEKGTENSFDMIFPGLWLGNMTAASNEKFIIDNKIGLVLNISKESYTKVKNITYYDIPLEDIDVCNNDTYYAEMLKAVEIIHNNIINKTNVLVHCKRGHHRSASIIAMYLVRKYKMSLYDAIYFIKTRRPTAIRRINCMLNILIDHESKK